MIELLGHPTCKSCEEAREYLNKTPLECKYTKVGANFEGVIPRLILENGDNIDGFPAIKEYVKRRMREMGFPEGML